VVKKENINFNLQTTVYIFELQNNPFSKNMT